SAQMLELPVPFAVYEDMIGAVLGTARALQLGSPSQAAGALLLGCPGSGRKTCAKLGVDLAKTKLKEPTAEDSTGLREELASLHGTIRSRLGSHTFGPLTEDHLLHGDCETILEDIDNILRQATRFEAKKAPRKAARRGGIVRSNSTVEGGKAVEEGLSDDFPDGASLAFLMILSPTLAANWFRRQLRKYPGLASGMDVVWLQPWGQEAYLEVAKQVLLPEVLA
ncbi:DHC1, partial [Symbiodinium sp. CCMP2456]